MFVYLFASSVFPCLFVFLDFFFSFVFFFFTKNCEKTKIILDQKDMSMRLSAGPKKERFDGNSEKLCVTSCCDTISNVFLDVGSTENRVSCRLLVCGADVDAV